MTLISGLMLPKLSTSYIKEAFTAASRIINESEQSITVDSDPKPFE